MSTGIHGIISIIIFDHAKLVNQQFLGWLTVKNLKIKEFLQISLKLTKIHQETPTHLFLKNIYFTPMKEISLNVIIGLK